MLSPIPVIEQKADIIIIANIIAPSALLPSSCCFALFVEDLSTEGFLTSL